MNKNNEIAKKLEQIKCTMTSYVHKNMNEDFIANMYGQAGSHAAFKTDAGLDAEFISYRIGFERCLYVGAKGQLNGEPIQLNFESSMFDYGAGAIYCGNYGIAFSNVGNDDVEPTIKPFIDIRGIKCYLFAGKAYDKILPLLDQLAEDIKSISPDLDTQIHLKREEEQIPSEPVEASSVTLQKEELKGMRSKLINLYDVPEETEALENPDIPEEPDAPEVDGEEQSLRKHI